MVRSSVACPRFVPATVSADSTAGFPQAPRRVDACDQPSLRHQCSASENVGSRFLSLLQSAALQTFSAFSGTAKKPNCRRLSRDRLGGSRAERYGQLLSEGHFLSEAWGLPDLLYKLFPELFQQLALVVKPESRNPFRLPAAIKGIAQPTASAPTSSCRHQRFAVAAPDLRTERAG
jgi:hypothetical protein